MFNAVGEDIIKIKILLKPHENKKKKLAQLVEHPFYTRQVKCSNHLFLTTYDHKYKEILA